MVKTDINASLVQIVDGNSEGFTKRQVSDAKRSWSVYSIVGGPSPRDFERMVCGNMIKNWPITVAYIKDFHTIFGPDVGSLCGKTVWQSPDPVVSDYISSPSEMLNQNSVMDVTADLMFVNKINFLVLLEKWIKFTTV